MAGNGTLFEDLAYFNCAPGYQFNRASDSQLRCGLENGTGPEVIWRGTLSCEGKPCLPLSSDELGTFDCSPGDGLNGDTCRLSCSRGSELVDGSGVYTCDGEVYNGVGRCSLQLCEEPSLPDDAVRLKPDCVLPLVHGATCDVICRPAHIQMGTFRCSEGVYTEKPACVFKGIEAQQHHAALASLRVMLQGSGASDEDRDSLHGSVVTALNAGLAELGIAGAEEVELQLGVAATRRLSVWRTSAPRPRAGAGAAADAPQPPTEDASRRLQASGWVQLDVTWRVSALNASAAEATSAALRDSSKFSAFGAVFSAQLSQGLNVTVRDLQLVTAKAVVSYTALAPAGLENSPEGDTGDDILGTVGLLLGLILAFACGCTVLAFWLVRRMQAAEAQAKAVSDPCEEEVAPAAAALPEPQVVLAMEDWVETEGTKARAAQAEPATEVMQS